MTKRLELAHELLPKLRSVGFLFNSSLPNEQADYKSPQSVAAKFAIKVIEAHANDESEISATFDGLIREKVGAVIVAGGTNTTHRRTIAEQALKRRLPTVFGFSSAIDVGGLISYASDLLEQYRNAAAYVDKIIKGARPGDLPVQQPTKFDVVINLKTAKALGIKIPNTIFLQATKVI